MVEAADTTTGGLVLTEGAKEKPTIGKVVAVGPGREEEGKAVAPKVAVGATVLYQKYAGTEVRGRGDASLHCPPAGCCREALASVRGLPPGLRRAAALCSLALQRVAVPQSALHEPLRRRQQQQQQQQAQAGAHARTRPRPTLPSPHPALPRPAV